MIYWYNFNSLSLIPLLDFAVLRHDFIDLPVIDWINV